MYMSKRLSNQGGAIRTFVIIAIILAILTIAAVYFVQKRGEQVRREQAIAAADQIAKDKQAADDKKAEETKPTPAPTPPSTAPTTSEHVELPATGLASGVIQLLMIGVLAGVCVAYISSRRAVAAAPLT